MKFECRYVIVFCVIIRRENWRKESPIMNCFIETISLHHLETLISFIIYFWLEAKNHGNIFICDQLMTRCFIRVFLVRISNKVVKISGICISIRKSEISRSGHREFNFWFKSVYISILYNANSSAEKAFCIRMLDFCSFPFIRYVDAVVKVALIKIVYPLAKIWKKNDPILQNSNITKESRFQYRK